MLDKVNHKSEVICMLVTSKFPKSEMFKSTSRSSHCHVYGQYWRRSHDKYAWPWLSRSFVKLRWEMWVSNPSRPHHDLQYHHWQHLHLQHFFTPSHDHNLRAHQFKISAPVSKTNFHKHFFSIRIIPAWSTLPTNLVSSPYINIFKRGLRKIDSNKFIVFPSVYYWIR